MLFVTVYLANDYPYYRVIHAICNWVKIILATEQKKTDFKPEDDSALALMGTTVSSEQFTITSSDKRAGYTDCYLCIHGNLQAYGNLLFLIQNIFCVYSKEPSQ